MPRPYRRAGRIDSSDSGVGVFSSPEVHSLTGI
jgi:hypothetical protein